MSNPFDEKSTGLTISNLEILPGKRVKSHLGVVQGSTVRAKHAGKDILAGLKNIVGGELKSYTELLVQQAKSVGANAILNVRYTTTSITMGAAEILAYGTAVILE